MNANKKPRKKIWIAIGVIAAALILIGTIIVRTVSKVTEQFSEAMSDTETVQIGEIEVTSQGTGTVSTKTVQSETIDYQSTVSKMYVNNGEQVKAGDVIAEFESNSLDESITQLESQLDTIDNEIANTSRSGSTRISSPVSGLVKQINVESGSSIVEVMNQSQSLMEISADNKLNVKFTTKKDVSIGQFIYISFDGYEEDGIIKDITGNKVTAVFDDDDNYNVDTKAQILDADRNLLGSGTIKSNAPVLITADSGDVASVSVSVNDNVSIGTTLIRLENVDYSEDYQTLLKQREEVIKKIETANKYENGYILKAENDCIISQMTALEGDIIPAGTVFCKLLNTEKYQVNLNIDELDIKGVEQGQPVELTADAVSDETFNGTVSSVALAGESENGVTSYTVTVELDKAKGLLPGMSATGTITVDTEKDALLVPIDAISTVDGNKTVNVVKDDGKYEQRKVTLGLVNNSYAQITKGLSEGEKVQLVEKITDLYEQMGMTVTSPDKEE